MSSPELTPEFIKITDVKDEYLTSRKTVERRRDKARAVGDTTVYRMFRLRTKDGVLFNEPTVEQVNQLTKEGRVPEWFVARAWLDKEFGKRRDTRSQPLRQAVGASSDESVREAVAAVTRQYEARITDLKEQLVAAARREEKALEYAEKDKQRFATATAQLTQVLALPGIAQATKAKEQFAKRTSGKEDDVVEEIGESDRPNATLKPKRRFSWWPAANR